VAKVDKLVKTVPKSHLWLLLLIFLFAAVLYYRDMLGSNGVAINDAGLGFTRHAAERIIFLIAIIYAGFFYGLRAGLICLGAAAIVMIPRAIFISQNSADALLKHFSYLLPVP